MPHLLANCTRAVALAAAIGLTAACGSSSKNNAAPVLSATPAPTPIGTIAQGTRPPGATPRPTAAASASRPAGSPAAGIPTVPPGTGPTQTTASGVKYQDIVVGTGAIAQAGQMITVHYTGWLDNGTKFDSSVDRGTPAQFNLSPTGVIQGWVDGIPGMKVGGKRRLVIPANLAYGAQGRPGIPPNATLTFDVELISIP